MFPFSSKYAKREVLASLLKISLEGFNLGWQEINRQRCYRKLALNIDFQNRLIFKMGYNVYGYKLCINKSFHRNSSPEFINSSAVQDPIIRGIISSAS